MYEVYIAVRLADGNETGTGRVEVNHEGKWGTICGRYWNDLVASFFCNEFGFPKGESIFDYGGGQGPIHWTHMYCTIQTEDFWHCGKAIRARCSHDKDVGVKCY